VEDCSERGENECPHVDMVAGGVREDGACELPTEGDLYAATALRSVVRERRKRKVEHRRRRHRPETTLDRLLRSPAVRTVGRLDRERSQVLEEEPRRLGPVHHTELPVDRRQVELDRMNSDIELLRDLGIRQAFRDSLEDLRFARR